MPLATLETIASLLVCLGAFYAFLRRDLKELRTEMRSEFADLRTEMRGQHAEIRTEMRTGFAALRAELKADIDRVDDRVYALATAMRPPWEQPAKRPD